MSISMILVPTDYSNCSGEAIRWAVSLAEPLSAGLLLLHVVSRDVAEEQLSIPGMSWDLLEARDERALRELYRLWVTEEEGASLLRETLVAIGDPAEKIVTAAFEKHADLIVIPSYGHKDPSTRSVSERVVRTAACPVLTIQAACCEGSSL
jgi:nucleotide-binding universal stress UspA family protein